MMMIMIVAGGSDPYSVYVVFVLVIVVVRKENLAWPGPHWPPKQWRRPSSSDVW